MTRTISEPDWKIFRQLLPVALERFCQRVLADIAAVSADSGRTHHERYLAVFRLLEKRDEELGNAFNNPRRSTAWQQLAWVQSFGVLTEEEMARFSPETRAVVRVYQGLRNEGEKRQDEAATVAPGRRGEPASKPSVDWPVEVAKSLHTVNRNVNLSLLGWN